MNLGALGSEAGAALLGMIAGESLAGVRRLPFADVAMTGPFWGERLDTVLTRTIPTQAEGAGEGTRPR